MNDSRLNNTLLAAAEAGNTDTVATLLDEGADINTRDMYEYTPLMRAVMAQQVEMVNLLLTRGADAALIDGNLRSALHFSSRTPDGTVIETGPVYDVLVAYWKARYMEARPIPENQARLYLEQYCHTNGKHAFNLKNRKYYEGWCEVSVFYDGDYIIYMPAYPRFFSRKEAATWEDIAFSEIDLDSLVW